MKKVTILLTAIIFSSCRNENKTPQQFIQKNKNNENLSILFNKVIEARNEKDGVFHYYYSHSFINNDTLTIPSFEYFDSFVKKDSTHYKAIFKLGELNGKSKDLSVVYAKEYAEKLDKIYKELGIINTVSRPKFGRFIEFTISPNCKVYYLENSKTLTPYWEKYLNQITKVDDKWFYDCK